MRTLNFILAITLALLGLIALLIMPRSITQAAPNATCTWIAPADGTPRNWSSAANWSCGAAPGSGDTAIVDNVGIVINVDVPVTVQHLTFGTNAELRGYQTLTVTGQMTWTSSSSILGGAALSPTGALETLVIAPGASLNLGHARFLQGTLVNHGTILHGNGSVVNALNAVFDNRTGGVFAAANASLLGSAFPPGPAGVFKNAGTLLKQGGGEYRLEARLTNAGFVNVTSDTLRLVDAQVQVVTHTGTFAVAPASTLILDGLKNNFAAASSIDVSGTLRLINGAAGIVRGGYSGSGLIDLNQAGLDFEHPGGTATLNYLNLDANSWLRGSNDITVTGHMTIAGQALVEGTSSNTNTLNLAPGATLLINQSGGLRFRTLNNYGSIVLAAGQCFNVSNDAVFNNRATGTYSVTVGQMGACLPGTTPGAQFNNQGRFTKDGASQFSFYGGLNLHNSGAFDLNGGTTTIGGAFEQTAGETLLRNAATLARGVGVSGDFVFNGGALRGTGTLDFAFANTVQNNGAVVDPIGLLTITDGGYQQGSAGSLQIDLGGLTPNTQYDVLNVSGQAVLNGRLILSATNGFLPASGDVFNVLTYGSRSGEFATVDHGAGLAFGPEYQSGGVVISDNPTLIEFSQKPDRRTIAPGTTGGYTLRVTNPTTTTVEAALGQDLPIGFEWIPGSSTSNVILAQPSVITSGNAQSLRWSVVPIAPGATITVHFGVAVTSTVGAYTNTASVVVTPTVGAARLLTLADSVGVSLPPITDTIVTAINAIAYAPSGGNDLWTIAIGRSTPVAQVSVIITSTPVCALPACGPLKRFYALSAGRTFTLTLVGGTTDRYSGVIPPGQFDQYEPIFLVPVFEPVTATARINRPDRISAGTCERVGYGYSEYFIFDPIDGATPCDPLTGEPILIDPSGYVTDAQTGAPIKDATVTLYRLPSALPDTRITTRECRTLDTRPGGITGTWDLLPSATANLGLFEDPSFSPATIDPPINPQRTNEVGYYGWDVIRGCWYIKVEAPGYFTKYSAVVGVPPEVTDLDIALEPWKKVYLPVVLK